MSILDDTWKKTWPKADEAFCLLFSTLEIMMPKQVGKPAAPKKISKNKKMRGYIDGGFDLVHSGHFNAIR